MRIELLLKSQLDKINKSLSQGVDNSASSKKSKSLNWKSNGIDNFITEAMSDVRAINNIISVMKSNLRRVEVLLDGWKSRPLFERANKTCAIPDLEVLLNQVKTTQYHTIKEDKVK